MSTVEIRPAVFRDVCFVTAHLREEDRREIYCQLPEGASSVEVAALSCANSDHAWCAWYRGSPVAAFGFSPATAAGTVQSAWAFGTRRMKRTVPAITHHVIANVVPTLLCEGVRRIEARSIADHDLAHRWLAGLGARREAELPQWGRDGEAFVLWSWTEKEWKSHVLQSKDPKNSSQAESADTGGSKPQGRGGHPASAAWQRRTASHHPDLRTW